MPRQIPILRKIRYGFIPIWVREELRFLAIQKPFTKLFGPLYRQNHYRIEIDIIYSCNLSCANCDRSASRVSSDERMSVEQIEKFTSESIQQGRRWERIALLGGEPTLHPGLLDMIETLLSYKKTYSPQVRVQVVTNGNGTNVERVLQRLPAEIEVRNSHKAKEGQHFYPAQLAPIDYPSYRFADYANACDNVELCGLGLTPYGYYTSAVAGAIDRIFGFDVGRKTLPEVSDSLLEQRRLLCQYCGYFRRKVSEITDQPRVSITWQKAYQRYQTEKPKLSRY
jgi:hypothetical protein